MPPSNGSGYSKVGRMFGRTTSSPDIVHITHRLSPVSTENVEERADGVMRSYLSGRLLLERVQSRRANESVIAPCGNGSATSIVDEPELDEEGHANDSAILSESQNDDMDTSTMTIPDHSLGQHLALVAQQYDDFASQQICQLVEALYRTLGNNATKEQWVASFDLVVDTVTAGPFDWNRFILVLCFGYRLLGKAWGSGIIATIDIVKTLLVRFITRRDVILWFAKNGGWVATQFLHVSRRTLRAENDSTLMFISKATLMAAGVVFTTGVLVYVYRRRGLAFISQ